MAEIVLPEQPAFGTLLRSVGPGSAPIEVGERLGLGLATVLARRGREAALRERVRDRFGIDLPDGPLRTAAGGTAVLGTAPGAWFALQEGAANGFAIAWAAELAGLASVADQSDGYGVLRLVGGRVPDALGKGVTLDLHPDAFRPGAVAVTSASHMGITLWRLPDRPDGRPAYEAAVFRSYAESFWNWLSASAAEFGLRLNPDL